MKNCCVHWWIFNHQANSGMSVDYVGLGSAFTVVSARHSYVCTYGSNRDKNTAALTSGSLATRAVGQRPLPAMGSVSFLRSLPRMFYYL